ncbi:hypothetical protein INR49_023995, partial [Caranx melampygus]
MAASLAANDSPDECRGMDDIRLWKHGFVLQYLPFLTQSSANMSLSLDKATTAEPCPEAGPVSGVSVQMLVPPVVRDPCRDGVTW